MKRYSQRAFTVVELLVVVSIIALLVGILLPAIGKARDQALVSRSQSNLRQIGMAWTTYAGEYNDRQLTFINDNMARYGGTAANPDSDTICQNYSLENAGPHPAMVIGYVTLESAPATMQVESLKFEGGTAHAAIVYSSPIDFRSGPQRSLGAFRLFSAKALNSYLNSRYYDPIFYAPKDRGVMTVVEPFFERHHELVSSTEVAGPAGLGLGDGAYYFSSYSASPAAMYNPDVFSEIQGASPAQFPNALMYNNPWVIASGFKSPSLSQARFGDLKTLAIEHHWLQNNKRGHCNPNAFLQGVAPYDGCQPYFFNASVQSNPVAVFYDGHVQSIGVRDAMDSNARVVTQTNGGMAGNKGLWSKNTPLGGGYLAGNGAGYYSSFGAADNASTSFHILTCYGIKGRDMIPR